MRRCHTQVYSRDVRVLPVLPYGRRWEPRARRACGLQLLHRRAGGVYSWRILSGTNTHTHARTLSFFLSLSLPLCFSPFSPLSLCFSHALSALAALWVYDACYHYQTRSSTLIGTLLSRDAKSRRYERAIHPHRTHVHFVSSFGSRSLSPSLSLSLSRSCFFVWFCYPLPWRWL